MPCFLGVFAKSGFDQLPADGYIFHRFHDIRHFLGTEFYDSYFDRFDLAATFTKR